MPSPARAATAATFSILCKAAIPGIALTSLALAACVPAQTDGIAGAIDTEIPRAQANATLASDAQATPEKTVAEQSERKVKPVQYAGLAPEAEPFQQGRASFYRHGSRTANGERFDPSGMTAAHRTLAFGTRVRVLHPASGRDVVVRINDRGPFTGGRVIDLAEGAARQLGIIRSGVASVELYREE